MTSNAYRFSVVCVTALCILVTAGCATQNYISRIERVVVFGDSNVDTGNLAKLFGGAVPGAKVWKGRNSNGPVVTEYLAELLDAELVTYAVSGATTGESNIVSLFAPQLTAITNTGMLNQITDFSSQGGRLAKRDLVILWAGSNDIYRADRNDTVNLKQRIDSAIANLHTAIDRVNELGATKIVIGTRTPRPELNSEDDLNGQDFNRALIKSVQISQANNHKNLVIFDAYATIKNMIQHPKTYAFNNVTDLCIEEKHCLSEKYEDGLSVANTYINWDAAHKTTRVHSIMATKLKAALQK